MPGIRIYTAGVRMFERGVRMFDDRCTGVRCMCCRRINNFNKRASGHAKRVFFGTAASFPCTLGRTAF